MTLFGTVSHPSRKAAAKVNCNDISPLFQWCLTLSFSLHEKLRYASNGMSAE
ncbi:predicted protein [Sclerotinia sclerotiorum 1980 UF-70]|uniref:Uncharacterized protein n=1 Tax=Sclerotinia sclerotiorum (strain ATCC 18683 / 1980 / Ss-1) TaxID=665079 RepID=A7EH44_SCLS1|nr:predicted protein [Sclerotinia sclerotiorum 1980 UF-70]EDO02160.1 predicted protein [Sclerotinia sclerotiorum 1980 UF-70]